MINIKHDAKKPWVIFIKVKLSLRLFELILDTYLYILK
jgi:hypothetical protein